MVSAQMHFYRSKGGFRRWLGRDAIARCLIRIFLIKPLMPIQRLDTKLDILTVRCRRGRDRTANSQQTVSKNLVSWEIFPDNQPRVHF
jgi:hypothetical protein